MLQKQVTASSSLQGRSGQRLLGTRVAPGTAASTFQILSYLVPSALRGVLHHHWDSVTDEETTTETHHRPFKVHQPIDEIWEMPMCCP